MTEENKTFVLGVLAGLFLGCLLELAGAGIIALSFDPGWTNQRIMHEACATFRGTKNQENETTVYISCPKEDLK